ncbi:MAG TPA: alpha/beta hydrolase [Burkholderiaceae bacterium]|nr:alpha/beta hydrolase [Burkholderiaceae bacterium]
MQPSAEAVPLAVGSPAWLDSQYNNRALVPTFGQHLQRWAADSAAARQRLSQAHLDVPYLTSERVRAFVGSTGTSDTAGTTVPGPALDVFPPLPGGSGHRSGGAPVLVFIHGGYWRALDKADHSFLAPPYVAQGACVVVPNYTLCPAVRVSDITRQMVAAVVWVWQHIAAYGGDPDRITVVGHSAGGQLVGMLLATDWLAVGRQLGVDLPVQPLQHGVSISGLFDMEPIRQTPFLSDLGLTPEEAIAQSPARLRGPQSPGRLTTVVGGDESAEFKRQNRLIREAWGAEAVPECEELPGCHHFSVLEELVRPGAWLQGHVCRCVNL